MIAPFRQRPGNKQMKLQCNLYTFTMNLLDCNVLREGVKLNKVPNTLSSYGKSCGRVALGGRGEGGGEGVGG